jgi:GMP synthase-like glutamine amidotransferase
MRIHYFQHVPFESLGVIRKWAGSRKHNVSATRWYKNEHLPPVEEIDWLIVMGGPMGISDENKFPWLKEEKNFILQAIQCERRVLGICLGAQLIASVLGAKVGRNPHKEIGWHEVRLTEEGKTSKIFGNFPEQFVAFHWHGDAYELPAGSRRLAQSEACREQAFVYNDRVLGLQFHLDVRQRNVEQLIHYCREDLQEGAYTQKPAQMLARQDHFRNIQKNMFIVLDRLEAA